MENKNFPHCWSVGHFNRQNTKLAMVVKRKAEGDITYFKQIRPLLLIMRATGRFPFTFNKHGT